VIKVQRVSKAYGHTKALDNFDLQVDDHETLVITGPSGSGKTTLLRLIAGLEEPDSGEISINGELASRAGYTLEPHRRNIGFVMQNPALWPHLNVLQLLQFVLGRKDKLEAAQTINNLLEATGLKDYKNRRPADLSGGEAQRLSIARALAAQPSILLLDEPLAHLDPELRINMLTLLQTHAETLGATTIHVSHHLEDAQPSADRVITLG